MPRHKILWVISLLVSTIFSFPNLSLSAQERRTALVIGNGNYKSAPLRNPVNDAEDMAKALRKLGFTVIHKQNATQRDMETSIRKFGERLRKGGVGLFYYAGHGLQVNGINYIIPLDAEIREETDVKYEAVDARRVLDAMYNAGNDLNIVILDACRDNPLARGFRSGSSGLARMDAPKGTIVAYSTSPGKLAFDGKGRNSPYTAALVDYMDDPGLTIEQVFKKCRRRIDRATNGKQIPWESTSLTGDFYFSTKGTDSRFSEDQARLERERREFEQAKAEFERKRQNLQSQKVEVASVPQKPSYTRPSSSTSNITNRDGIYVAYANGIVKDTKTGLEWKAGPDRNTDWNKARSWVKSLNLDGGGWRMPTTDELKTLFKKGAGNYNRTSLLKSTGWNVWSNEVFGGSEAFNFDFYDGYGTKHDRYNTHYFRAFAVRSRGGSQNQKVEVASLPQKPSYSPPSSTSSVTEPDGTYVAYANGIVRDTSTGLEWKVGPDKDTNWHEARSWVRSLNLDGGGWRMPTIGELEGLYKKGSGDRNRTPLLKATGWNVWSGETKGSSEAMLLYFGNGRRQWWDCDNAWNNWAFAVRSRSDAGRADQLQASVQKITPDTRPSSTANVINRDGIYVAYANGVVKDTSTGLEWKAGPDENMDWNEARSWVQSLNLDGGGWRMPTIGELESLYKDGEGPRNMTPLLETTGWKVWSGAIERNTIRQEGNLLAWFFSFYEGYKEWAHPSHSYWNHNFSRAFAVRSQSDG